jgi:hypothetical protein
MMMTRKHAVPALIGFALLAGFTGANAAGPPSLQNGNDETTYADWRAKLLPSAREDAWRAIAWRPAVWDAVTEAQKAVTEAQKADKPLLVWLISGPGLGHC